MNKKNENTQQSFVDNLYSMKVRLWLPFEADRFDEEDIEYLEIKEYNGKKYFNTNDSPDLLHFKNNQVKYDSDYYDDYLLEIKL